MTKPNRHDYRQRAAQKRGEAGKKGGGRASRVAGHLALAYGALARVKSQRRKDDARN